MTAKDRATFKRDIERRELENIEKGMSGEEALFEAQESAEMAYDEYQDRLHEEGREDKWEKDNE